ncbi:MAG: 30S ribosomal protein S3 [Planctomycetes bacterium]|nr:30S ribosomal protein S3 [Planctomycetota bacterium]
MGHKVSPLGFRVGITENWRSRWFTKDAKLARNYILEDFYIRKHIVNNYKEFAISKVEIERYSDLIKTIIHSAKPGTLVGKKGSKINQLSEELTAKTGKRVEVEVKEITNPILDAQIVANSIAVELERRMPQKRVMHKYVDQILEEGAEGARVQCQGRLGGAEIARKEYVVQGKIPLHTLMADIDYATSTANLTKGTIGIKVWIYKGDRRFKQTEEAK